jgi:hypothetical protein
MTISGEQMGLGLLVMRIVPGPYSVLSQQVSPFGQTKKGSQPSSKILKYGTEDSLYLRLVRRR